MIHTREHEKKRTEINMKQRHSYIAPGSVKFNLHWETFLAISVKFTKVYILFPVMLNLRIILTIVFVHTYMG